MKSAVGTAILNWVIGRWMGVTPKPLQSRHDYSKSIAAYKLLSNSMVNLSFGGIGVSYWHLYLSKSRQYCVDRTCLGPGALQLLIDRC